MTREGALGFRAQRRKHDRGVPTRDLALSGAYLVTAVLLGLRWWLAETVGFGDSEALYASYALHPQPAYLDHPGLIGSIARLLGGGQAPGPVATHRFTAIAATALPWLGYWTARGTGAERRASLRTFYALALLPEISIGLFALTPDLPLAYFWLGALLTSSLALRHTPGSLAAHLAMLGTGACVGLACLSKVSGALLGASLLICSFHGKARRHWRTLTPLAAVLLAGLLVSPVLLWESKRAWPMLAHRLVATQEAAGWSIRNLGALLGGQLLYVTPPFLLAGARLLPQLFRARHDSPIAWLLLLACIVPGAFLGVLCLWSRVAEPHWLAPAYLSLAVAAAHDQAPSKRLDRVCLATGFTCVLLLFGWIATDWPIRALGRHYEPRFDLANDLHAWGVGHSLLDRTVSDVMRETGEVPVVVGPHYVVCAQAHAHLGPTIPVGCRTPAGDDFAAWFPEWGWRNARTVLFVHDSRFDTEPALSFPDRRVRSRNRALVVRGGRTVRTLFVTRLERRDAAAALPSPEPSLGHGAAGPSRRPQYTIAERAVSREMRPSRTRDFRCISNVCIP